MGLEWIEALGSIVRAGLLKESGHIKSSDFTVVRDSKPSLLILKIVLYISKCIKGSTNTKIFKNFIKELLPYYGRWPAWESILIIDNALFYHSDKIQQMCDSVGVILLYLPPYSPNFNSIKEMFKELKTYIRQVWDKHIGFVRANFLGFLEGCVTITVAWKASARGYFYRAISMTLLNDKCLYAGWILSPMPF